MTQTHPLPLADGNWWKTAVVYQVYPRSFADSDADEIGDINGLRSRLPYLSALGVDAIWLSPFYPSPLADGGYDVADYRDVDPRLGSLTDFDNLVAEAHAGGLKIIVDIVPNHTSDQHPWFQEALRAPVGSPARDRYIFRDGAGVDGNAPPSDWRSHFGGSAWEQVDDGQWYCHLFTKEQPDLNWANTEVRQHFLDTLRFWADRGVNGFRIDVAHTLAKDLTTPLRSQPQLDLQLPVDGSDPLYDRDAVHAIYEQWRRVFDEYDPPRMAVAETWYPRNSRSFLYARPTELGQVFDFSLLKCAWDRDRFVDVIRRSVEDHAAHHASPTWVLSNHDEVRHSSRLALPTDVHPDTWLLGNGKTPPVDADRARRRARAATLLMLALPGSAYLYQGEELGLLEVADLQVDAIRDPTWERSEHVRKGRDGCRVPLPWTRRGSSFGFGEGGAWLPQPDGFGDASVEAQDGVDGSCLEMYRAALRVRKQLQTDDTRVEWLSADDRDVVHFRRSNGWACIVNFSMTSKPLPSGLVRVSSQPLHHGELPAETAVWTTPTTGAETPPPARR